jgi:hypothetical protein
MHVSGVTAVNIPRGLAWIEYLVYLRYSTMAFFTVRGRVPGEHMSCFGQHSKEGPPTHLPPCVCGVVDGV